MNDLNYAYIDTTMTSQDVTIIKLPPTLPQIVFSKYKSYMDVGFNSEQAFDLTKLEVFK